MQSEQSWYINREMSWLEFNRRVLHEALPVEKPLFERLKFLSIFSSNLDEFFMVRVGNLYDQLEDTPNRIDPSGLMPGQQILKVAQVSNDLMVFHQQIMQDVLEGLRKEKAVTLVKYDELNPQQKSWLKEYYASNIYPVLTPIAIDNTRAFPLIANKSLNIMVLLEEDGEFQFVTIQVPSVLERFIEVRSDGLLITLEDVIKANLGYLLRGRTIVDSCCYRVIRHAGLEISDDESMNLLSQIESSLKRRKWGEAVRMDVESTVNPILLHFLTLKLDLDVFTIFKLEGLLDSTAFMKLKSYQEFMATNENLYKPQRYPGLDGDIFEALKEKDHLLFHPYDDFSVIVEMIKAASRDPGVLAIKQVLYRVSGDSSIVKALLEAVENGKQVTVLVELMARFDEENNILWAKKLEKSGCHVIYGFHGMKTHSKITLIIRRETSGIKRYIHLGTGNYNDKTAKLYTDYSLLSANETLANEASMFFNILSGYVTEQEMKKLVVAPYQLRNALIEKIDREITTAKQGHRAYICIKVNSLVDPEVIEKLYEASESGVEVDLIVRGVCCLRPGLKGVSERIHVRSILGKYLEHSRIYYFHNHGHEEVYLASADLMTRNLNRRIEIMFPVENQEHKMAIWGHLQAYLNATIGAQILLPTGHYISPIGVGVDYDVQEVFEQLKGQGEHFYEKFKRKILKK